METVNVGLIGFGGMGHMHFGCYANNPNAKVVAMCDIDPAKFEGGGDVKINISSGDAKPLDLTGVALYTKIDDLLKDPNVRLVDICLPTRMHAEVSCQALESGKDVFCEKPMAWNVDECARVERAIEKSGKQFAVGHCLRYWPQYMAVSKIVESKQYGDWRYARLHRSGSTPGWSWNNWLCTGDQSGGAVIDMHIHDADAALWWFGKPQTVKAAGIKVDGLPLTVDAMWTYEKNRVVSLHGGWDLNGGDFRYAFKVVFEDATVAFDSALDGAFVRIVTAAGTEKLPVDEYSAYQSEIDDIVDCLQKGRPIKRITAVESKLAVEIVRSEMDQIEALSKID